MKRGLYMNSFESTPRAALKRIIRRTSFKWGLLCTLTILLFTVIAPNIDWIKSPLTPPIQVRIIDADTQKPVTEMHAVIRWAVNYSYFPGAGYGKSSHIVIGKTDKNGEIRVGRKIKPLGLMLFPIMYRDYAGIHLFTVDNRYHVATQSIGADGKLELRVQRVLNIDNLLDNQKKYNDWAIMTDSTDVAKLLVIYRDEARSKIDEYNMKLYGRKQP